MKKMISALLLLILSNVAKAGDIGLDIQQLKERSNSTDVVARNGVGTCGETSSGIIVHPKDRNAFMNMTIRQLKDALKSRMTIEQKQQLMDQIEKALIDEESHHQ